MECGSPENGTNTVPVPTNTSLQLGDQYMYSCLPGFKPEILDQEMVAECTDDGTFSLQPPPSCIGR